MGGAALAPACTLVLAGVPPCDDKRQVGVSSPASPVFSICPAPVVQFCAGHSILVVYVSWQGGASSTPASYGQLGFSSKLGQEAQIAVAQSCRCQPRRRWEAD